jgi:hypothetical protein
MHGGEKAPSIPRSEQLAELLVQLTALRPSFVQLTALSTGAPGSPGDAGESEWIS